MGFWAGFGIGVGVGVVLAAVVVVGFMFFSLKRAG